MLSCFCTHCSCDCLCSPLAITTHSFCFTFALVRGLAHFCHSLKIGVFSFGWFTRKFFAPVALPLGAGKSPTGLTIDLPPLLSPAPETPRLTFF